VMGTLTRTLGVFGVLLGGWVADRFVAHGRIDGPIRVGIIGAVGVLSALLALGLNANRWKIFATVVVALVLSVFTPHLGWKQSLLTGVAAGGVFLLIYLAGALIFKTEALGLGDVKLAVFIGLVLGLSPTLNALLLGVLLAGLVSIGLVVIRVKKLKDTIAYGPYLCAGAIYMLLRGAT